MKQVTLITVSDKMASYIDAFKSEEDLTNEKNIIADCYRLITTTAMCYGDGTDKMGEWGKLLTLISSYQAQVEMFHEEANRE